MGVHPAVVGRFGPFTLDMRTALIIVAGIVLLGVMVLVARYIVDVSTARAALVFLPVWLVVAGLNMWVGVAKAGYSVSEEAPIAALIFAIPALCALALWWTQRTP